PELIPAVVALVAHPDDERCASFFGTNVVSPLFGVRVEERSHELAKSDNGSGSAIVCTLGSLTHVPRWRGLYPRPRPVINRGGRLNLEVPEWIAASPKAEAVANYEALAGKTTFTARKDIAQMLTDSGDLIGEIEPITHPVPFYEKGDKPLEVVTSRQWYI